MKKVGLLLFSLSIAASNAFAGQIDYIIKDGKLANGVTAVHAVNKEGIALPELNETENGYAELTHGPGAWTDAKLKID